MGFEVIIAPRSIAIVKALKREKKKRWNLEYYIEFCDNLSFTPHLISMFFFWISKISPLNDQTLGTGNWYCIFFILWISLIFHIRSFFFFGTKELKFRLIWVLTSGFSWWSQMVKIWYCMFVMRKLTK
jgi:hypothetical protein